jgi:hypothetical protein
MAAQRGPRKPEDFMRDVKPKEYTPGPNAPSDPSKRGEVDMRLFGDYMKDVPSEVGNISTPTVYTEPAPADPSQRGTYIDRIREGVTQESEGYSPTGNIYNPGYTGPTGENSGMFDEGSTLGSLNDSDVILGSFRDKVKDQTTSTSEATDQVTAGMREQELRDKLVENMNNPTLADNAKQTATLMSEQPGEILDPTDPRFQAAAVNTPEQTQMAASGFSASESAMATATTPQEMAAAQASYTQVANAAKGTVANAAKAMASSANVVNAQAAIQDLDAVDPRTMAKALTHEVPNGATVQGQLDGLLSGLETGNIPLWAQPAVTAAESMMSSRGMSASSVGQNAMFNAIINSAMPIAQADAKAKLSVFQQDITNEQQAILSNSQFFQTLTVKNLDNRQQAAIVNATNATNVNMANAQNATQASVANAQAFLQMDLANLSNEQQTIMVDAQYRQQTMLTNTAAENTAKQMNASNAQQAEQFNANLSASISQFNATQVNAAKQFNAANEQQASQVNANAANTMAQFTANLGFQREQFNAQNATVISQANVAWRRQLNQSNTAAINAVNQANAMNQFSLSNQALSFLWQEQRDAAQWANDNVQNDEERKTRLTIAALTNEAAKDATTMGAIKDLAGAAIEIYDNWE